ncbi:hypothetical protein TKK_0006088 [Trichogramma kaykai]|uniref:Uncharacterized protein n=1 Tax=Trichogramma kaykai TaxID=54128 RepID=A0ABD2XEV0_9HYME
MTQQGKRCRLVPTTIATCVKWLRHKEEQDGVNPFLRPFRPDYVNDYEYRSRKNSKITSYIQPRKSSNLYHITFDNIFNASEVGGPLVNKMTNDKTPEEKDHEMEMEWSGNNNKRKNNDSIELQYEKFAQLPTP